MSGCRGQVKYQELLERVLKRAPELLSEEEQGLARRVIRARERSRHDQ